MEIMSSKYMRRSLWGVWWVILFLGLQLLGACGGEGTPAALKKEADLPRDRALVLSNKDGWPDLYTVDLTGKFVGRLTESPAAEYSPAWSPDGRRVVFTELNGDEAAGDYARGRRIVVIDADGQNRKVVTQEGFNPVWSPDSKSICFIDQAGRIFVTDVAGGTTKELDKDPWMNYPQVSWSSDSKWLAYTKADDASRQNGVWIVDTKSGEKHQITSPMFSAGSPAFDRDGNKTRDGVRDER